MFRFNPSQLAWTLPQRETTFVAVFINKTATYATLLSSLVQNVYKQSFQPGYFAQIESEIGDGEDYLRQYYTVWRCARFLVATAIPQDDQDAMKG